MRTKDDVKDDISDDNTKSSDGNIILELPPPPDGGWGWVILSCTFLGNLLVRGTVGCFGVFFDSFALHFQEPKAKIAWASSLQNGLGMFFGPIVSGVTNRFGCRPVIIFGSVVAFSGIFLSAFSPVADVLVMCYALTGIGFGFIYLPGVVAVSYYFEKKRALASSIATCGAGVGHIIFAPLGRLLQDAYGWQGANIIISSLLLHGLIIGALNRPLKAVRVPKEENEELLEQLSERRAKRMSIDAGRLALQYSSEGPRKASMANPTLNAIQEDQNVDPDDKDQSSDEEMAVHVKPTAMKMKNIDGTKTTQEYGENPSSGKHSETRALMGGAQYTTSSLKDTTKVPAKKAVHRVQSQPIGEKKSRFKSRRRKTTPNPREMRRPTLVTPPLPQAPVYLIRRRASAFPLPPNEESLCVSLPNNPVVRKSLRRGRMVSPLSRKDTFYTASIKRLKEKHCMDTIVPYRESVVTFQPVVTIEEKGTEKGKVRCPCVCLHASCWVVMSHMLDISLLKCPEFLIVALTNFFSMMGYFIPITFLVDAAVFKGTEPTKAAVLLSILGISNTVGRAVSGVIASLPRVNPLFMFYCSLFLSGVTVGCVTFCNTYLSFCCVAALYGLVSSGHIALLSVIMVDLLGLDRLTSAFGLLSLFQGFSCMIGAPLAGAVFDASGSYDFSFTFGGCTLILASLVGFLVPLRKWYKAEDYLETNFQEDY